ncbi:hypothetical protein [Thalassobacillus sp. CUG 92003]|uniref:hypothetical protein n=1 Tax=Thalassobacillus sp. CUG 92003 TaxID=2736641 RepID=UPI0015E6E01F|nr:hypothetical protein [Thalassobacillus sp. CUG 92003]
MSTITGGGAMIFLGGATTIAGDATIWYGPTINAGRAMILLGGATINDGNTFGRARGKRSVLTEQSRNAFLETQKYRTISAKGSVFLCLIQF